MGQKVNPIALKTLMQHTWRSRWFSKRSYTEQLLEDLRVRAHIQRKYGTNGGIDVVEIERGPQEVTVAIHTAKPGLLIGRSGQGITALKAELESLLSSTTAQKKKFKINIIEVKKPDLRALLVGQNIANQLQKRISFKRAMRIAAERAMSSGALGVRVKLSGRLGGVEIAREQVLTQGTMPLSRFKSDIDFATVHAKTTYGVIGVKVWINRGITQEEGTDAHTA